MKPLEILQEIRKETSEIILFHSLAGKDSIMLLELCSKVFDTVHCVFMYMVADLKHMAKYREFFEAAYKNVIWHETPHFARIYHLKVGSLGNKPDPELTNTTLAKITNQFRQELNLQWVCFGSKQMDGLHRRLQLKTYEHEAIDRKNFKVFPLSKLTNKEVLDFIRFEGLIEPLNYGDKRPSQSNDLIDPVFLNWCKTNYPEDYQKIKNEFPNVEIILFRHETKTERND